MSDSTQAPGHSAQRPGGEGDEISFLDLLIVLTQHKEIVIGLPLLVAVIAAVVSLLLPFGYTGTTRILPPQTQSSAASMLSQQLSALGGLGSASIKNPNDLYIGMLNSRTLADNLIQRFDLNKRYGKNLQSDTRVTLAGQTNIVSGKDGIISIDVDDADAQHAADLANAYVEELFKLTQVLAVTEASQRRLFFERQLAEAKDKLDAAEAAARDALETGGLMQVQGQGRAIVATSAQLRGQISVKEVEIGAMRAFATDRNPDLRRAQQELLAMKRELARIEGSSQIQEPADSPAKSAGKGKASSSADQLRNVTYAQTVYELLGQQVAAARIDEARDSTLIQVLDKAIVPDRRSKPKRTLIVLVSALVAGFVAALWAFTLHAIRGASGDPHQAARLALLRENLRIFHKS